MTEVTEEKDDFNNLKPDMENFDFKLDFYDQLREMHQSLSQTEQEIEESKKLGPFPVQNTQEFVVCSPITLEKKYLSENAYSVKKTTNELLTDLQDIQITMETIQLTQLGMDALGEVNQELWQQILELRLFIHTNHFTILNLGTIFHSFLRDIYAKHKRILFLEAQSHLEYLLINYNSHNPYAQLKSEEKGLRQMQMLNQLIMQLHVSLLKDPLSSPLQQQKPGRESNTTQRTLSKDEMKLQLKLASGAGLGSKGFVHVKDETVLTIQLGDEQLELKYPRKDAEISTFLTSLENILERVITIGKDKITEIKILGNSIGYNVYSHTFGDSVNLTSNEEMINSIRDQLAPLLQQYERPKSIENQFIIIDEMSAKHYLTEMVDGEVKYTEYMHPGESREHAIKRHESIIRGENQTHSIMQSSDQATQDSFETTLENEKTKRNAQTTDTESHVNQSDTTSTHQAANVNASVTADIKKVVNVSVNGSYDWGKDQSQSQDQGSSIATNTAREDGVRILQNSFRNHTQEVSSARESAREQSVEQTETVSTDETQRISYSNPNQGSSLNIEYIELKQKFATIISLEDIRVLWTNGVTRREEALSMVNRLMDDIFQEYPEGSAEYEEVKVYREFLWNSIMAACHVRDYQSRIHNIACSGDGIPQPYILKRPYLNRLKDSGTYNKEYDEKLEGFEDLNGIVLSIETNYLPEILLKEEVKSGPIAYDLVELGHIMNKQLSDYFDNQRKGIANSSSYHTFDKLMDIEDPVQFGDIRFLTKDQESKSMYDKIMLLRERDEKRRKKH